MERKIPLVTAKDEKELDFTLSALVSYGLNCAEITLRTPYGTEGIRRAREKFPAMNIGAGTVLTKAQCRAALDAGAQFVVSPGLSEEVAKECFKRDVMYFPGCVTPTEIMRAMEMGIRVVKFFPASVYGGLAALKALSEPFGGVKFFPTGGVNEDNADEYLACDFIYAVGGSSFTKAALAKARARNNKE